MNKIFNTKNIGVMNNYPLIYEVRANAHTRLIFSLIFVILMAISANSYIYLPFTPVPITTQVFTVLISGMFLGSSWAFTSQLIYILAGLMGLPVFSGFKNGVVALSGPTGGYIIGFMAAAFASGYIYENLSKNRPSYSYQLFISFISCITGVIIIHFFGFIHLAGYFYSLSSTHFLTDTLIKTWKLGTEPFILVDLVKTITAVLVINLKKTKNEKDKNK